MESTPLTQIGRRLEELDQQIHTCLKDIRRNLAELESVSENEEGAGDDGSGGRFADMLKASISRRQGSSDSG